MSTSPVGGQWTAEDIRPVSRLIALARTGHAKWLDVFSVMQEYVGWEIAGRWLTVELEIAGVIKPEDQRRAPHYGSGERRDLRPVE